MAQRTQSKGNVMGYFLYFIFLWSLSVRGLHIIQLLLGVFLCLVANIGILQG
jgi:hypothetical protein